MVQFKILCQSEYKSVVLIFFLDEKNQITFLKNDEKLILVIFVFMYHVFVQ